MEGSDLFRAKSEQMKFANSYRRNKGRTGPLGEVGIKERLRQPLQHSLAPEEVYDEMNRDKGHSEKSKSTNHGSSMSRSPFPCEPNVLPVGGATSNPSTSPFVAGGCPTPPAGVPPGTACPPASPNPRPPVRSGNFENPVLLIILKQISDLRESPLSETDHGRALISALEQQLRTLQARLTTTAAEDDCVRNLSHSDDAQTCVPSVPNAESASPSLDCVLPSTSGKGTSKRSTAAISQPQTASRKSMQAVNQKIRDD
ncbi:hypothetical protein M758_3G170400 [Ceratodon purpureus]|nr:hypothetical protein M758_3G170400 [Ceratodon purpureus]